MSTAAEASTFPAGMDGWSVSRVVLTVAGLVLCLSAAAKGHGWLADTHLGDPLLGSRAVLAGLIELELLLGLWFIFGGSRQRVWLTATVVFGGLLVVALYLTATQRPSCGCFGKISVRPWVTVLLDAGLLLGLLGWPPTRHWKGQQGPIWMVFLLFNGIGFLFWLPTWT